MLQTYKPLTVVIASTTYTIQGERCYISLAKLLELAFFTLDRPAT
jgi:hypothetical protein